MTSSETIGERLRRLRLERGLSQRALAGPGVSYGYISRVELGQRLPSMKALRVLARGLGVSVQYLETGRELGDAASRELRLGEAELALRLDHDVAGAEAVFRDVLAEATVGGDARAAARARIGLGLVAAHRGDHPAAIASLEHAVARPWIAPHTHPDVYATLGHSYASAGRAEDAVRLLRGALDDVAARRPIDSAAIVRFASYLSYALSDLGDVEGARAALAEALRHAHAPDDAYTRVRLYWSGARLASLTGDHETARVSINRAIALLETSEDTGSLARAHVLAAELALHEDDLDDARTHLEAASPGPAAAAQDRAWHALQAALVEARSGNAAAAIDHASEAVELLDDGEDGTLRGRAQWALGEALAAAGSRTAARAAFARASELIPPGSKYAAAFVDAWSRTFPADAGAGIS
ncbi:MAG TPA: helix-turn-helix transcriptional regulator [Gaiellaceae bacterium]|nr:helix-turn-helix transcriptional regulator [Gaiellaceae bacterium]